MYIDVCACELLSTHYWPARPECDIGQIVAEFESMAKIIF